MITRFNGVESGAFPVGGEAGVAVPEMLTRLRQRSRGHRLTQAA